MSNKADRIGSAQNLQKGGTYDLLMVKVSGNFPEGEVTFGLYDTPNKITGIQKVGQAFLKALLTSKGSDPFYPDKGTYMPNLMVGSNITEDDKSLIADIVQAVQEASSQVRSSMNTNTDDPSSSLDSVEVLGVDRVEEGWFVVINLLTLAGENAEISIPFPDPAGIEGEEVQPGSSAATPAPVVDFVGIPLSGVAPLTVSFYDLSNFSPNRWEWDFQNNGSIDSYNKNPVFIYPDPGVYSVSLRAYNNFGSGVNTKISYINVTAPVVEFTEVIDFESTDSHPHLTVTGAQVFDNSNPVHFYDNFDNFPTTSSGTHYAAHDALIPIDITVVGAYMIKRVVFSNLKINDGYPWRFTSDTGLTTNFVIVGAPGVSTWQWNDITADLVDINFVRATSIRIDPSNSFVAWAIDNIRITLVPIANAFPP